jgi:hypothetical protein
LSQFASAPLQLNGSMSQGVGGNNFEIALSFGPAVETPEPG